MLKSDTKEKENIGISVFGFDLPEDDEYSAVLWNDEQTPFEFVLSIVRECFGKSIPESVKITRTAHETGRAVILTASYEVVDAKVNYAHQVIAQFPFPLKITIEEI